jgi:membrane protein DedA with SNARE-associated domain
VLEALLDWLRQLPAGAAYAALMVLSALENIFPPVPADTAVALGAFLARRGQVSIPLLGLLCWAANMVSASAVYALARAHGPAFFSEGLGRRLLPRAVFSDLRDFYARHGVWGVFLSRFLPGLRAGVLPFAGVAGMGPLRALVPAAAASGIWYAFLVLAGSVLADNWDAVRGLVEGANALLGLIALLAAAVGAFWLWRRARLRRLRSRQDP